MLIPVKWVLKRIWRSSSVQLDVSTEMGFTAEGASKIYLRPETAQGNFYVNFLKRCKKNRLRMEDSFSDCTNRKAFRTWKSFARQVYFECCEFEQMELQFFRFVQVKN